MADEAKPDRSAAFAAKATDLDALRASVVDAAGVGAGLWISYLFVLFYLLIAAGGVTHRDLLFEHPIKLPFLNVELPLIGFFVLGPLLFLIVHAYVLLHFVLLADKVGVFHEELAVQIADEDVRARLRRQLPSNIFVQYLAGPREVRTGVMGFMLRLIAQISLVAAPLALLVFILFQFLPYHHEMIAWWQRLAVVADLALLWTLWPAIARGETASIAWRDFRRGKVAATAAASAAVLVLVFSVATFPGELLDRNPATLPFIPAKDLRDGSFRLVSLHDFLLAGDVDLVARKPTSLLSNRLVLPNVDLIDRGKFDSDAKIAAAAETFSLRGRRLERAVLIGSGLRKVDFTAANLQGAWLNDADLRDAKFECAGSIATREQPANDSPDASKEGPMDCANLQGASLVDAQLQQAKLGGAQLQDAMLYGAQFDGALLGGAQLQRAKAERAFFEKAVLSGAQLQDAVLFGAHMRGALLARAQLQGATLTQADLRDAQLSGAQLQGANLDRARLRGAFLKEAELWRATLLSAELQGATLEDARLLGADLSDARLEGASLAGARLQGASLHGARLQGATLNRAVLHGTWLLETSFQGATFDSTQLQGADFRHQRVEGATFENVLAWRARSPNPDSHARVINPEMRAQYPKKGRHHASTPEWTVEQFKELKELIEAVPEGRLRDQASAQIVRLDPTNKPDDDEKEAEAWVKLASAPLDAERYEAGLREAGCGEEGAPYVIRALLRNLPERFEANSPRPAALAAAFLDESKCPGAKGLSDEEKRMLREIRDRPLPEASGPTAAAPKQ